MSFIEGRITECRAGIDGRVIIEATVSESDVLEFRPGRKAVVAVRESEAQ